MTDETSAPSIDELEAKSERLANEVLEATSALEVAKSTFADAAKSDPTAVETLLELATAVKAAEATVSTAEKAVSRNQSDIDGIRYDEAMSGVTEATLAAMDAIRPAVEAWFADNSNIVSDFAIDTLVITAKREESGVVTCIAKPTGEAMPKRPTSKRTTGGNGKRGTRNVTVDGTVMSCREYVASCGDQASPAAQADINGTWEGAPVSYTNEAKRLAAKNHDTFA